MSEEQREIAEFAVTYVEDGMRIGLGSGTTVYWMLQKLGERVRQGLRVQGIPSSVKTERLAREFGIPLTDFSVTDRLDLTIDGAKEIDASLAMIKGGGGSFFREKIIAVASEQVIIIAERNKQVTRLGAVPVPVEILPFGWEQTVRVLARLGCEVTLRTMEQRAIVSDNGNYIADCAFERLEDPGGMDQRLRQIPGVLETGLFCGIANQFITTDEQGFIVIKEAER